MTWDPKRDTPAPTAEAHAKAKTTKKAQVEARQRMLLTAYADTPTFRAACRVAGVPYRTAQQWKQESEESPGRHMVPWPEGAEPRPFHECLAEARQMACDLVEEEIRRRAFGYDRELVHQGRKTGQTIREHSDLMLIFYGKRMVPDYRDNHQVNVTHGGKVEVESARTRLEERLLAAIERRTEAALGQADPAQAALTIDVEPVRVALPAPDKENE